MTKSHEDIALLGIADWNDSTTNTDPPQEVLYHVSAIYLAIITSVGICLNAKALIRLIKVNKVSCILPS